MANVDEQLKELREAIERLSRRIDDMKEEGKGTPTGIRRQILETLEEESGPLSVTDIADRVGRAASTTSGYVLDLYRGGFIERSSRLVNVGDSRRVRQLEYFVPQQKKRKWHYL